MRNKGSLLFLLLTVLVVVPFASATQVSDQLTVYNSSCGVNSATDLCGYTVAFTVTDLGTQTAGKENFQIQFSITDTDGTHPGTFALFQITALAGPVAILTQASNGTAFPSNGNNGGSCTGATSGSVCFIPSSLPFLALGQSFSTSFVVTDTSILTSWNWKTLVQGANGNIVATSATGTPSTVPEPGSLALLGSGLLAAGGIIRRRIGL